MITGLPRLKFWLQLLVSFQCLIFPFIAEAQVSKILATEVTFTSPADKMTSLVGCGTLNLSPCFSPTVVNPNFAINDDENFARLFASPGLLAGLASYDSELELKFPNDVPANTWSFVRIDADPNILEVLLGGNLGKLISDLGGATLLGRQVIGVEARNSTGSVVLSGSSSNGFVGNNIDLVKDNLGRTYLAVKPQSSYDRVRVKLNSGALAGLGSEYQLDVYSAFYFQGQDNCGEPEFTSFNSSGLSLDLLDLGSAGVTSPEHAIDGNPSSFSEISIGMLGVGAEIFQEIRYSSPSSVEDYFKVSFSIKNPEVLNADVIGGIEIKAFSGDNLVFRRKLSSGLINGLDVLTLLQNGEKVTLAFGPGRSFDRVTVGYNSILSLNALANSPIQLYEVERFGANCPDPSPINTPPSTLPMLSNSNCSASVLEFENANFPFNTVDGNNDSFTTLEASSGIALGIGDYEGFIELGFSERPANSASYIRIDFDEEVLTRLLNGSVGNLVGDVVDNTVFGRHFFTVEVKNNGNPVVSGSSRNAFFERPMRIVQDKNNHFYVEVIPNSPYNSIRITETLSSIAGFGKSSTMNVYHVCSSTGFENCEQAYNTYVTSDGISLDLLGISGAGVSNAGFAIDGNPATASEIKIGTAGIGASIFQIVQFHSLSNENDNFRIKLALSGNGIVNAEVLGSIVVKAFNGDNEVFSQNLRDGLISDLNLLELIQNRETLNLSFGPGAAFDRLAIGLESLVSAGVISVPLQVFSIERFSTDCPDPELPTITETDTPFNNASCSTELISWSNVNFPFNAVDGSSDSFATLSAGTGSALGLGSYSSHIELGFSSPVPANETSYIRIELEGDLLNALLAGSLGSNVADLLGTVALGDQYFTISPKNSSGQTLYTANSTNAFGNQDVKIVKDSFGKFYIAFTANQPYQSVRLEYFQTALVGLNNTSSLKVFSLCRETEIDVCEQASFTSFTGNGIAVDLVDISKGGVFNPENTIDSNTSNFSTINLGIAGAGASVFQEILFKTKSQQTDKLRIKTQLNAPGLLNLDIIGSYRVVLYNGAQEVYNQPLQNAIINNVDLLGLLNSGGIQELLIEPNVIYDRVAFGIVSTVSVNTSAPIRLYEISRVSMACPDPDPETPPFAEPVCAEELISASNADNLGNLFDGNFATFATIRSQGGTLGLGGFSGHLELGYGNATLIPAGTTSYIRIDASSELLNTLLSGNLGADISNLTGSIALGDFYFDVTVKDQIGNTLSTGSSRNSFEGSQGQIKVVKDAQGRFYLAITPNSAYNRIRIESFTDALLLGEENTLNVYGLCFDSAVESCGTSFTTSVNGSGITLDVLNLGGYGVSNPERALANNNNDDFSEISLGAVAFDGSIQQNIQFNQVIPESGVIKLKLGIGNGILDAGIFSRIELLGYRNGVQVYQENLASPALGSINLLDLFNNGSNSELRISLGVEVDEVAIRLRSLLGSTIIPNVRLFFIQQDCEAPSFQTWKSFIVENDATINSVRGGELVQYTIHIRNNGVNPMLNYQIEDAIPLKTTYVSGSGGEERNGVIHFENINIAPGATVTRSFSVRVERNLTDIPVIPNVALIKANETDPGKETFPPVDNENPTEPDESGDTGTNIPVDPIFDAFIWKAYQVNGDPSIPAVKGGEVLKYIIFVRNTGNQDLRNLTITDELPAGVSYVSGGNLSGNSVSFSLAELEVGQTSTAFEFTVSVNQDLTGLDEILNIANLSSSGISTPIQSLSPLDNLNPNEPNINGPIGTRVDVLPVVELAFTKNGLSNNSTSSGLVEVGDLINYSLIITNSSNRSLLDLEIQDLIPNGLELTNSGGGSLNGDLLEFSIPSLGFGETITFEFQAEVKSIDKVGDPIVNIAELFYTDELNNRVSISAQNSIQTSCSEVNEENISINSLVSEICSGGEVTLTAQLTGIDFPNPVFKWFTQEDLSGSFFEGQTYTVSPQQSTVYYVIVEGEGFCFVGPATTASVLVNSLPPTPQTNGDLIITEGSDATFTAFFQPEASDVEIVWYDEVENELAVGSTFNPGILPVGTYRFFAGTRNTDNGCLSNDRAMVLLTVTPSQNQNDCTIANSQIVGTSGLCINCTSRDENNAIDGNPDTFSRLTVPAGVNGSIFQTLGFSTKGANGDTVKLSLGLPGGLSDASLISAVQITLLDGNTPKNSFSLNNSTLRVTVLSGDRFDVFIPSNDTFDRVEIRLTGLSTLITSIDIYQAQLQFARPTSISENVQVCVGESTILEAVPFPGNSIRWYNAEVGGVLLADANTFTTPQLNNPGEVIYYIAVVRDNCEDPRRIPVSVKVNPRATASDITANSGEICEGDSFTLSATAPGISNPVFRFFTDAALSNELSNLTVSPSVTTTYYVSVSGDGVCENAPNDGAELIVTVNRRATAADISPNAGEICEGDSFVLSATAPGISNPVFRFFTDVALSNELSNLTVSPSVTTTYYVSVSGDGVCENAPNDGAELIVTVNNADAPIILNPNQSFCIEDNPTLNSISIVGVNIRWYATISSATVLDSNLELVNGATYYATQTDPETGCESISRASVTVSLENCQVDEGLQIRKVADVNNVLPGDTVLYTITVINTTPLDLNQLIVSDTLDSRLEFISASNGGSSDGQVVIWNINSLPSQNLISLSLRVRVSEDAIPGTSISNLAVVQRLNDPNPPTESDPEVITVEDSTSLRITKIPNVNQARIGDEVIYTIEVTNTSSISQENLVITDFLSNKLTFVSANGNAENIDQLVEWRINSLESGQSIELSLVVTINEEAIVGDIIFNTAIVSTENGKSFESDPGDGVEVIGSENNTEIVIEKLVDKSLVSVGEILTYTILVQNTGDFTANNLLVTDSLPSGTVLISSSPEVIEVDNILQWEFGSLAPGQIIEIVLNLLVGEDTGGSIINKAFVIGDNFPPSEAISPEVLVQLEAPMVDLEIKKEVSSSIVQIGKEFEYRITVTNISDNQANEILIKDLLPLGVEFRTAVVSGGVTNYDFESREISWRIEQLSSNQSQTLTLSVLALDEGEITNIAFVESNLEDSDIENNTDSATHRQLSFVIPNVYTPNGDGINDTWQIRNLQDLFERNEVLIVNRWGVEVYQSTNYQNDWTGNGLAAGTYFYQLRVWDLEGQSSTLTGFVTIIK